MYGEQNNNMRKILSLTDAVKTAKTLQTNKKQVVVTGGCFDILHIGHIKLLENAKQQGDSLFVFLESDEKIRQLKGTGRPLHTQEERAEMLAALTAVDYVVCLPFFSSNDEYDKLVSSIHPQIIAVTKGDKGIANKQRQATTIGAQLAEVVEYIPHKSTSAALTKLLEEA